MRLPGGARRLGRALLSRWGRSGVLPGTHHQWIERLGATLGEEQGVEVRLLNGCRMRLDLGDEVQRLILFCGLYEPCESYVLCRVLAPGMTFVDGGANVGQYTLLAATAVGPRGHVLAFEPVPRTCARLRANVEGSGLSRVTVERRALWREDGEVRLGLPAGKHGNAGAYGVGAGDADEVAPAVRLDTYCAAAGVARVDVVKLDLEGAELAALQGMRGVLARDRPLLLVEVCVATAARLGAHPTDLWRLLHDELGYEAWLVGQGSAGCRPLRDLAGLEQRNVLFHHGPLPAALREPWDFASVLRWAGHAPTDER